MSAKFHEEQLEDALTFLKQVDGTFQQHPVLISSGGFSCHDARVAVWRLKEKISHHLLGQEITQKQLTKREVGRLLRGNEGSKDMVLSWGLIHRPDNMLLNFIKEQGERKVWTERRNTLHRMTPEVKARVIADLQKKLTGGKFDLRHVRMLERLI